MPGRDRAATARSVAGPTALRPTEGSSSQSLGKPGPSRERIPAPVTVVHRTPQALRLRSQRLGRLGRETARLALLLDGGEVAALAAPGNLPILHDPAHQVGRYVVRLAGRTSMWLHALLHEIGNDAVLGSTIRLAVQLTASIAAQLAPRRQPVGPALDRVERSQWLLRLATWANLHK